MLREERTLIIRRVYFIYCMSKWAAADRLGRTTMAAALCRAFDILDDFQVENIQLCAFESHESSWLLRIGKGEVTAEEWPESCQQDSKCIYSRWPAKTPTWWVGLVLPPVALFASSSSSSSLVRRKVKLQKNPPQNWTADLHLSTWPLTVIKRWKWKLDGNRQLVKWLVEDLRVGIIKHGGIKVSCYDRRSRDGNLFINHEQNNYPAED